MSTGDEPDHQNDSIASAIQAALEAPRNDDDPEMVTGFVVMATRVSADGVRSWSVYTMDDQVPHVSMGLADQLVEFFRSAWVRHLYADD